MGGFCQGSPLNTNQSSCSSNGGQWMPDPNTGTNSSNSGVGGGVNLSEIFGGISSILGPLGNFGANMYAVSQGQPQVPFTPVVVNGQGQNVDPNTQRNYQTGSSNMIWWVGGVVLLLIIVAVVIMVMKKKQA